MEGYRFNIGIKNVLISSFSFWIQKEPIYFNPAARWQI